MPSETYIYKHASGVSIPAHVHYAEPPAPASSSPTDTDTDSKAKPTPRPIAIIFHAGGFTMGSTALIPPLEVSYLTNTLNFIVVLPEYRLCPQVSLFSGPVQDARSVYAWSRRTLPSLIASATGGSVLADGSKVVVMGHSAGGNLALLLGSNPSSADPSEPSLPPPAAILDLYGVKYLSDPFYRAPLPLFAHLPDVDDALLQKVYEGDQALTSAPMLLPDGRPNLADPRAAWLLMALKRGTSISGVVQDGAYERVDGAAALTAERTFPFPPTCFIHGTADEFVPGSLAERAKRELSAAGGTAEVIVLEGVGHAFDLRGLKEGTQAWEAVRRGMEFLGRWV